MPVRKTVPSLKDLCLSTLSSHSDYNNPFPDLPVNILDDIVNNPKYSTILHRKHLQTAVDQYTDRLHAIINQHTDQIDFHRKPDCVVQRGIRLICTVQTNLTHLNISYTQVSHNDLKKLSRSIPNIVSLQLRATQTQDDVLTILSKNCPNLRELDVSYCFVTDTGLKSLSERCRLIRGLRVTATAITDDGASAIISNLPHLRYFDYKNILTLLETTYDQNRKELKLETIHDELQMKFSITNSTITSVSYMCQNITTVVLTGLKNSDRWLPKLAGFPRLENLSLTGGTERDITFTEYVEPLLVTIGKTLKSLYLSQIQGVKIWYIGVDCGGLEDLSLIENNRYLLTTRNNTKKVFSELRSLRVECSPENDISSAELEILLSNCHRINHLSFHGCQSFNDALLIRIRQLNSFSELFCFDFLFCSNIRKSSFLSIIKNCNSLRVLNYLRCGKIRSADHRKLQRLVLTKNLDLILGY